VALIVLLPGCEEEIVGPPPGGSTSAQASASASSSAAAQAEPPVMQFNESDFTESEDARDPFREYRHLFLKKQQRQQEVQRRVAASQYALDELKLVGIITRSTRLVMLQDPTGFAWSVGTGEYIGKPEMVSLGGPEGQEVAINWRVDRIRPTDVVFIREDSAHPEIPPTTRVMPLYPDESTRPGG
jgi:type IV pilus assembly protein PilP